MRHHWRSELCISDALYHEVDIYVGYSTKAHHKAMLAPYHAHMLWPDNHGIIESQYVVLSTKVRHGDDIHCWQRTHLECH